MTFSSTRICSRCPRRRQRTSEAHPNDEDNGMLNSHHLVSTIAKYALAGVSFGVLALSPASSAQRGEPGLVDRTTPANLDFSVAKDGVPNLASIAFAWLSDGADWMDPPAGTPGHGRITNDPHHPFIGTVDAILIRRPPPLRTSNPTYPLLLPWP